MNVHLSFSIQEKKDQKYIANPWGHGLHPTNVRYEPAVYAVTPRSVTKDSTCIAMTRALGDFYAHQFGLTHRPDIQVKNLKNESQYTIMVGSDGVWDCWKYGDFVDYILAQLKNKKNIVETTEITLTESIQRAITNFGAKHFDDASLIAIHFIGSPTLSSTSSNSNSSTSSASSGSTSSGSPSSSSDSSVTST